MQVLVFFDEDKSQISVWGRTDYPDCGDFKIPVFPGGEFCGLSYEDLVKIEDFETDPVTQAVIKTTPRRPRPRPEDIQPIPDFLRKKPVQP
ncbi:hypothetical protein [Propionivibrio limicola]|uniref:hypothetical protein n=1 Tax=Propionivibrio limicola TaxID=167645 RepID=UPI001290C980|nr:hypothetical protein [Propionivibrio limicola]